MTARRKATEGKGSVKKLKLKRETLKDLDPARKEAKVKGGDIVVFGSIPMTVCLCITIITKCDQTVCATGNMFCRLR
jgi:hypothetical protein